MFVAFQLLCYGGNTPNTDASNNESRVEGGKPQREARRRKESRATQSCCGSTGSHFREHFETFILWKLVALFIIRLNI